MAGLILATACSRVVDEPDGDTRHATQLNPFGSYVDYDVDPGIVLDYPRRICIGPVTMSVKDDAKPEKKPPALPQAEATEAVDPQLVAKEAAKKTKETAELLDLVRQSLEAHARMRFEDLDIAVTAPKAGEDEVAAALGGCSYWLTAKLLRDDQINTLFWARRRLGIELRLTDVDTGETLWTAHHTAARNEASIPLDPVSIAVGIFRTQDFAQDKDVLPSMVDDVMRRLFATFPALPKPDEPHRGG